MSRTRSSLPAGGGVLPRQGEPCRRGPAGRCRSETRRLYSRALHLLDRAVMIARAGASRLSGDANEPEADAQRLRAAAILGLKNPSLALVAAKRARQLSPLHPLAYHLSAAALVDMNSGEEAAMTLLTGSIVSGDRSLGSEVMTLYTSGVDAEGCASSAPALAPSSAPALARR